MSDEISLWGPVTADTTPETVFTNAPGTVAMLESMTLANPSAGGKTTVVLSLQADAAARRVIEYPVPAGAGSYVVYPMLRIVDGNVLQLSSTLTDDVVVTTGNGYRDSEQFSPLLVPEVAAGFFWDAELGVTDLGAAAFKWAEQNGRTAADQLQATPANQPALITNNGHNQFSYAIGTQTLTAGSVKAGWTGDTYIAGWFRFPEAPLLGTACRLLTHQTAATGRRRINFQLTNGFTTDNILQISASWDGTNSTSISYIHPDPNNWHFIECFLRPGNADVNARRAILIDGAVPMFNGSTSAASFTTLNDPTEPLSVCGRETVTPTTQRIDCGWLVYTNGIPSDTNRARLYNYKRAA